MNGESDSWGDYYDPRYTPAFAATFTNPDLKALAEEQCKGDQFCLYDIAATRDPKVGITTFEGGENLDVIINGSKPGNYIKQTEVMFVDTMFILSSVM